MFCRFEAAAHRTRAGGGLTAAYPSRRDVHDVSPAIPRRHSWPLGFTSTTPMRCRRLSDRPCCVLWRQDWAQTSVQVRHHHHAPAFSAHAPLRAPSAAKSRFCVVHQPRRGSICRSRSLRAGASGRDRRLARSARSADRGTSQILVCALSLLDRCAADAPAWRVRLRIGANAGGAGRGAANKLTLQLRV